MRYEIINITRPDTILNPPVPGQDKLTWVSPYAGIRQKIEESIANGYQSRYYTENDGLSVDPFTGNMILKREYTSLEGAQDMKNFLSSFISMDGSKILEVYINQIDDDGTVTRLD